MTVPAEIAATGFELPAAYLRACRLGLRDLEPWRFLRGEAFIDAYAALNAALEERILVPFAARSDCGELACFEVLPSPSEVVQIYQLEDEGLQLAAEFSSFWEWFRLAIDDLIQADPSAPALADTSGAMTWEWFRRRAPSASGVSVPLPRVASS